MCVVKKVYWYAKPVQPGPCNWGVYNWVVKEVGFPDLFPLTFETRAEAEAEAARRNGRDDKRWQATLRAMN